MSVLSVALSKSHNFSKEPASSITLIKGFGVEGDCHSGTTVRHRSRLHIKPPPPNLRQVHLIQYETLKQFDLKPSDLGENIKTDGVDLLALSRGTKIHFLSPCDDSDVEVAGGHPVVVITGLRNPCPQIEKFRKGLQEKFIARDGNRNIVAREAGVTSTVEMGGKVDKGMKLIIETPAAFAALECV